MKDHFVDIISHIQATGPIGIPEIEAWVYDQIATDDVSGTVAKAIKHGIAVGAIKEDGPGFFC